MYFKIKNNILFRQYCEYGYLTDNSMFGYRYLDDDTFLPGERYVSQSAAIMLSTLSKAPKHIDDIVNELINVFVDVEYDELSNDTIDFFMQLVNDGFLSCGETFDACNIYDDLLLYQKSNFEQLNSIPMDNCSKNIFSQNDFLRSIHIEIANECNERCVHCYIPHELKVRAIDTDLFYKIIEDGRAMNIINVTLSGGEPLLHKDIIGFLSKCRDLDLSVNILTNLTLLTDDIILEMKKNPLLSVQTSLYSMNSAIHDSITKVNGSYEKTKNNILKLKAAGIPLQISCPVMKQNKDSFMDAIEWGNKNNIGVSVDYVIFAAYDRSNYNLENRLSLDEIGEAVNKQTSREYINMMREIADEKEALTENDPICSICRYNFCISAEGKVFPCVGWQTNVIGDLNTQSIREIWETSKDIQRLREIKRKHFPKCVTCKDRGFCTVCMMSNSNENGDAFKVNDFHCKAANMIHNKVDFYLSKR